MKCKNLLVTFENVIVVARVKASRHAVLPPEIFSVKIPERLLVFL